eukprot:TRINITY_DN18124_c0_g1_i1.p1 TRINITY_DN18124_c0_g1~~TRINITY_DN18124_c0_g1_i1.p1  ORF type:complete len:2279 (+),score=361.51 TRINITY_DN18124_c0_g1_i1:156-6992(+)
MTKNDGDVADGTITCTQNQCLAYSLKTGERYGTVAGCTTNPIALGTTCSIECDTGYSGSAGSVTCPGNAIDGATPTVVVDPGCVATCLSYTCSVGYSGPLLPNKVCLVGGCDDATCCTIAPCPADSDPVTMPTVSCPCKTGFTGTPTWDSMTMSWSHVCAANCGGFICPVGFESKGFASNILCNPTGCTQPVCCDQDCIVPTVVGATVTGCTEAVPVRHGTVCTWVAEVGAVCTNVGSITCNDGTFPLTPTCAVDSCDVNLFDFATANIVLGQSLTPCDTVPQGTCSLTCEVGYTGPAVVSCTAVNTWTINAACQPNACLVPLGGTADPLATDYSDCLAKKSGESCQPTCNPGYYPNGHIVLTCAAMTGEFDASGSVCSVITCTGSVFDPVPHNAQAVTTGGICDTALLPPCTLTCLAGYSGTPTLSCTAVDTWTVTGSCTDTCSSRSAVTIVGTDLPTGTDIGTCTVGAFTATSPTCQVSNCEAGYTTTPGPATITCSNTGVLSVALNGFSCTEVDCQVYTPAANVDRGTCSNPIILQPHTNPTCDLQCATGYQVRSGTGELRCWPHSLVPTTTLICEAIECDSLLAPDPDLINAEQLGSVFPCNTVPKVPCPLTCKPGYTPGTPAPELTCETTGVWNFLGSCEPERCDVAFDFAANNLVVQGLMGCNTVPDAPCMVACNAGWSGTASVSCTAVDTWTVTIPCTENMCKPFNFPDGITGGIGAGACTDGIVLGSTTQSSCDVTCLPGYRPDPATNAGTVTCSSTANNGDDPQVDITCQMTCGLYGCVHPQAILRLFAPSSIDCLGTPAVCTDTRCCVGVIVDPTVLTTTENGRVPGEFSVRLVSEPTADVVVPIVNTNIAEGEMSHPLIMAPGTSAFNMVFTPTDWNVAQTVTITGLDDFIIDGDVTYKIEIRATTSADAEYNNLEPDDVTVTNLEVTRTETFTPTISDSLTETISESPSWTYSLSQTDSETLTISLTETSTLTLTESITPTSLTLTESFTLTITESLSITESIQLPTDTETFTISYTITPTESFSVSEQLPTNTRTDTDTIDGTETVVVTGVVSETVLPEVTPTATGTETLLVDPLTRLSIRESRVVIGSTVAVRNTANGVWLLGTVLKSSFETPAGQVLVRTAETSAKGAYYDHMIPAVFFPGDQVLVRNNLADNWVEGIVERQYNDYPVIRTSTSVALFDYIRPAELVVGGVVLARDTHSGIWQVGIVTHSGGIQTEDGKVHLFSQVLNIGYRPGDVVHSRDLLQPGYQLSVVHGYSPLVELTLMRDNLAVQFTNPSSFFVQPVVFPVCNIGTAPNMVVRSTSADPFQVVGTGTVSTVNPPGEITVGNTKYNQIQEQGTAVGRLVRGIPPTGIVMELGLAVGEDSYLSLNGTVGPWQSVYPNDGDYMDSVLSDGVPDLLVNISTGPNGELLPPVTLTNGTINRMIFEGYERGHPVHVRDNISSGWRSGFVQNSDTSTDPLVTRRWHQYYPLLTESSDVLVREGDSFQWSVAVVIQKSQNGEPPVSRTRNGVTKSFLQTIPAGYRINSLIEVRDSLTSRWLPGVVANVAGNVPTVVLSSAGFGSGFGSGVLRTAKSYLYYRPPLNQLIPGSSFLARNNDGQEWQPCTIISTSSNETWVQFSPEAAESLTGQQAFNNVVLSVRQIFPKGLKVNDTVRMRDSIESWTTGVVSHEVGDSVLIAKTWAAIQPQVLCEGNLVIVRDSDVDIWRAGVVRSVTAQQTLVETEPSQWEKTEPAGYSNGDAVLVRDSEGSAWKKGRVVAVSKRLTLAIATVKKSWPHIRPEILTVGMRVLVRKDSYDPWQEGTVVDASGLIRTVDDVVRSWQQIEPLGYRKGDRVVVKDKKGNQERGVVDSISLITGEATVSTQSKTQVWPHIHPMTISAGSQVVVKDHVDEPWRLGYVDLTVDDFSVVPSVATDAAWWNQILPRPPPVVQTTPIPDTPTPPLSPVIVPTDVTEPTVFIHSTLLKSGCTDSQIIFDPTCWDSVAFKTKVVELMPDIKNCGDIINVNVAPGAAQDPEVLLGVNFDDCPPSSSDDLLNRFHDLLKKPVNKGEFQSVGTKIHATYILAPNFISNRTETVVIGNQESMNAAIGDDDGIESLWWLWLILGILVVCCCLMILLGRSRRNQDKKKWEEEAIERSVPAADTRLEDGSPDDYDSDNDMCMKGDVIPYEEDHYSEDDFRLPLKASYSDPSPPPVDMNDNNSPLVPSQYYTPPAPDAFEYPSPVEHYRSITKPLPTRSLGRGTLASTGPSPGTMDANGQRFPIKV